MRVTLNQALRWLQKDIARLGMLIVASALLVLSLLLPYWSITLHAPQYPKGLNVQIYTYKLTGDVAEVDGLNHYIGMIKLDDAGKLERSVSRFAVPAIAVLALASFWIRGRWRWLAVTPVLLYPVVFVVDLFVWLYYAGHNLDPTAALSSAIKPFTPRLLGEGVIGQFSTTASFGTGFYMALASTLLVLVATLAARSAPATRVEEAARETQTLEMAQSESRPPSISAERHIHVAAR